MAVSCVPCRETNTTHIILTVRFILVGPRLLSDPLLPEDSAARRPYVGCMKLLVINGSPVSFSKADLVRGAVSVGTCPAA